MEFQAVIFDLDGTLLDSERQALAAGRRAFEAVGVHDFEALLHSLTGMDYPAGIKRIRATYPELDIDQLNEAWEREVIALQSDGIPLKPTALEVIDLVDQLGLPKAIATSSGKTSALRKLSLSGLADRFDTLVTRDDVTRAKPHPEPFLTAAGLLNTDPAQVLGFEDSELGAQSAYNAGLHVVQVADMVTPSGDYAHVIAQTLWDGARKVGLA